MKSKVSFAGLIGAAVGAALSVSPSLIPRSGLIQGLLLGVLAALGYGLGAALGWALRRGGEWHSSQRVRGIALLLGSGTVTVALLLGRMWQAELAELTGVGSPSGIWVGIALVTGVAVFVFLLMTARGVRWLVRRLDRGLQRAVPPRVATASAVTVSVLVGALAVDRVPDATVRLLDPVFSRMNAATPAGVTPPTSTVVSGGPGSMIPWADLGSQGRAFVAGVTPTSDLEQFSGKAAAAPIRAFVGVDSAQTPQGRAAMAVAELERFGAFERAVIAVGTSAGSGTVDPGEVTPLEYLLNGDVATVSTQYSILPSFLSFAVDQPNSVEASKSLISAVRTRVLAEPASKRPRVVVFGESLGAYGASGAFGDLAQMLSETDGAMFQGPPNSTALWQRYTAAREPGSPQRQPVYDNGRNLRWANTPAALRTPDAPFEAPRIVYLQNASDPVVWWSPRTLWQRPDWLAEPRGPGVLTFPWLPVVTFAGLSGDMINSQGVPPGHGHVYGTAPVQAWADILRPAGWTAADTERLVKHLGGP
ncbi:MAG: alpha/beta-hydrolase family protein [Candidatus Nanopelagicales bacterium]|nr:alpha/beta-hydrolase family protein [Candidatus Nanopelagicales bacterium]